MKREWKAAWAATAAASGIGFSSGRTIAMFFSQMGWASWIGVAAASAIFGILCGGASALVRKTGADSLSGVCSSLMGMRFGRLIGAPYGLLMAFTAIAMLCVAGELAALTLSVRHARWMGMMLALGCALLLNVRCMRGFAAFGAMGISVCTVFYAGLALDPRPVRFYRSFETIAELAGSVPAALLMAGLYAALCAAVSFGVVAMHAKEADSASGYAVRCGLGMLIMLASANAALTSGGEKLLSLALPNVALAARWGTFGYYACIASMALPAVATLGACLEAMLPTNEKHDKNPC